MPKRSNDFQRLIYLVRLNLAAGAKVIESKMMRDRITRARREVDVVIEGTVGGQTVRVSIECRDHKRVADVQWVEQMKTKHERLDTNALLLASRSGFTEEALAVARVYGIDTFTLEPIDEAALALRLHPTSGLWFRTVKVTPAKVTVTVGGEDDQPIEHVVTSPDHLLYLESGAEIGQVKVLVEKLLTSDLARQRLTETATEEHNTFVIEWIPPSRETGEALFMRKLDPPLLRVASKVRVVGPCSVVVDRFDLSHGKVGSVHVAWGKGTVDGRDAMAVATRDPTGKHVLSVNFKGPANSAGAA